MDTTLSKTQSLDDLVFFWSGATHEGQLLQYRNWLYNLDASVLTQPRKTSSQNSELEV
jgi:hypothetical protein